MQPKLNAVPERTVVEDVRGFRFDYSSLPSSVASFLRGQADRIRRHYATSIIQMGRALVEAKRHLSHGTFLQWVECEVCIPARTAQAYMRVALWAGNKSATVARLSPSMLYMLSAPGAPQEFVTRILDRAEAGEHVPLSVMREELRSFRAHKGQMCATSERCHDEKNGQCSPEDSCASELVPSQSEICGELMEFVFILERKLSPMDFARVQEIAMSEAVQTDPCLADNLRRAFECSDRVKDVTDIELATTMTGSEFTPAH